MNFKTSVSYFIRNLREKHRLSIRNQHNDSEVWYMYISPLNLLAGFLALVLMQFQIGPDLGLALAKGVVLSLVTVFTFMPALTLVCYPWMDKTHHKPLLPSFDKFGRFVSRIMLPAALALAVIMVPSYLASNNNEYYYGAAHMFGTNTRLGADTAAIEETFGKSDTWVVLVPEAMTK